MLSPDLTSSMTDVIQIARIGAPLGLKGWLHLYSFLEIPEDILKYRHWQLGSTKPENSISPQQTKAHSGHFAVKFENCDDRDQASVYTNLNVFLAKTELPALASGEFYIQDLMGIEVTNEAGEILGKVFDLFDTGANQVLVVKSGRKQTLIPFVFGDYILDLDLTKRQMQVHWDSAWD